MNRIRAVMIKEFWHILRDPKSLTIVFLMPVLMIFIYGYAISFDLKRIDAGVIDLSQSDWSKKLIQMFAHNHYYQLQDLTKIPGEDPIKQGEKRLRSGALQEYIILPADFASKIENHLPAEIGWVIDGSDSNVANIINQYNEQVVTGFINQIRNINQIIKINTKVYFNPEVKSSFFFIPGLVAILLIMISALLTSLSIAREKESGSIHLLFISPLRSYEIILGKTVPYILVALIEEVIILLFARFWFQVPIRGNLWELLVFSLVYIITGLAFGILISTLAPDQRLAMLGALLSTMLPSIMLSGFIFPIESLPAPLQFFSRLVPATYFLRIIRGMVLKGSDLNFFLTEGVTLILFAIVLLRIATIKFNRLRRIHP